MVEQVWSVLQRIISEGRRLFVGDFLHLLQFKAVRIQYRPPKQGVGISDCGVLNETF